MKKVYVLKNYESDIEVWGVFSSTSKAKEYLTNYSKKFFTRDNGNWQEKSFNDDNYQIILTECFEDFSTEHEFWIESYNIDDMER